MSTEKGMAETMIDVMNETGASYSAMRMYGKTSGETAAFIIVVRGKKAAAFYEAVDKLWDEKFGGEDV